MLISDNLQIIHEKPLTAKILCAIMLMLIILVISNLISDYKKINNPVQKTQHSNFNQIKNNNQDIKKSLQIDIFGRYIPKQLGDTNIKPSLLDVNLLGVMYSDNKKSSTVLLRFANGLERSFKLGDTIPGGAKIIHILLDGVIVKRDGTLERINLPKNELLFGKPLQPMH